MPSSFIKACSYIFSTKPGPSEECTFIAAAMICSVNSECGYFAVEFLSIPVPLKKMKI
jgi:hypothetical protein